VVQIDAKFRHLIPPLSDDEFGLLRESIIRDGCRDPLVVWEEEGLLLDGHNRFDICAANGIEFKTVSLSFAAREEAEDWIDANQLGRRNLSPDQASLLRGRRYNRVKKTKAEAGAIGGASKPQNEECLPTTAETLATQHGVSRATIERDGAFASAVEAIKETVPDIEARVMTGDIPSKKAVVDAAKEPESAAYHLARNSGNNEWYTPSEFIGAARRVMGGIDLDPASCEVANRTVKAENFYSAEDDGLSKEWFGRVWLNPPYSGDMIGPFCEKVASSVEKGLVSEAIVLVHNSTETAWFARLVDAASAVVFPTRRIQFVGRDGVTPAGSPLRGQAFVYFGERKDEFMREFLGFGWGAEI
jgi:ParB family chromosome partitioning protein